jgi:hypothetical protein
MFPHWESPEERRLAKIEAGRELIRAKARYVVALYPKLARSVWKIAGQAKHTVRRRAGEELFEEIESLQHREALKTQIVPAAKGRESTD